ncbi:heterokaryon incompatibility protein [Macrophomina phaseolina]|uniref:Heterokaryon incompatibility protein n=1 Tax=Macrophomina phaseolina TaxID=35725 RepID=A0ABQ8GLI5_9PEZI|nr:heterokaryon incompatibility protein [Macrophomina phaseolina]
MQAIDYTPIPPGSRRFRILSLQPSESFSAEIVCTLTDASLDSPPEYEALSYVWGDPAKPNSVTLAGRRVGVTENLATALRHLRLASRPRHLWVDALCIDQHNIDERDDQVMHMKEIYQRCSTDLLWLSEDGSILEKGAAVMESIGTITQLEENFRTANSYFTYRRSSSALRLRNAKDEAPAQPPPEGWTEALAAMFRKPPVWQRVWIMQEVAFAPRVQLVAGGGATLAWERVDAFLDVDRYIAKHGYPDAFHEPFSHGWTLKNELIYCLAHAQILAHQRRIVAGLQQTQQGPQRDENAAPYSLSSSHHSSLLEILARFRYARSTDPRDMVFALLGLTSNPLSITPTYHASARAVYISTAAAIINAARTLDLLCQPPWQLYGNEQRDPTLPSWVPDFAHPGRSGILFAQRDIYAACGDEVLLQTPCEVTGEGGIVLEGWDAGALRGLRAWDGWPVGVKRRVLAWAPNEVLREGIEAGNETLRIFLKEDEEEGTWCSSLGGGEGGSCGNDEARECRLPRFEAYWRTLTVDTKRYPVARLGEADLREMREKWEALLRLPWIKNTEDAGWRSGLHYVEEGRAKVWGELRKCVWDVWPRRFAISEDGSYVMAPTEAEKEIE